MVIATQNPIEMEGTYPLPEAQRDRFMARVSMGYPEPRGRAADARRPRRRSTRWTTCEPVADASEIAKLIDDRAGGARRPTRSSSTPSTWSPPPASSPDLRLGASPRATLHLVRAARAAAALDGRDYVLPDDLQALAVPVLAHRLLPPAEAQLGAACAQTTSSPTWSGHRAGPDPQHRDRRLEHAAGAARPDHPRARLPRRRDRRVAVRPRSSGRRTCCGSASCSSPCRSSPRSSSPAPATASQRHGRSLAPGRVAGRDAARRCELRLENVSPAAHRPAAARGPGALRPRAPAPVRRSTGSARTAPHGRRTRSGPTSAAASRSAR